MIKEILNQIKTSLLLLLLFTLMTGFIYPLIVTLLAQLFFPWQANGSIILKNGKPFGSLYIGQSFTDEKYFWSRPSATTPFPYNAASSMGSNLGPSNPNFLSTIKSRIANLQQKNPQNKLIPIDLVTASGSGLDPEISPFSAYYQVPRIAKARNLPEDKIQALIANLQQSRTLGILGEPRVNVLQLNMALDAMSSSYALK